MIAAVWFIIDWTCGLVLRARKGRISISRRRRRGWKSTYEFIPASAFIASVRFPVTSFAVPPICNPIAVRASMAFWTLDCALSMADPVLFNAVQFASAVWLARVTFCDKQVALAADVELANAVAFAKHGGFAKAVELSTAVELARLVELQATTVALQTTVALLAETLVAFEAAHGAVALQIAVALFAETEVAFEAAHGAVALQITVALFAETTVAFEAAHGAVALQIAVALFAETEVAFEAAHGAVALLLAQTTAVALA
jgi:hypothetical protein